MSHNFKSYVALNNSEDAIQAEDIKLKMLTGEAEVARAKNAIFFDPTIKKKSVEETGIKGLLIVTNFRVSFLSPYEKSSENLAQIYQENNFLGKTDVPLSIIDHIYQITDKKRKLFGTRNKTKSRIDALQIICKNFRTLKIGFREVEMNKAYVIAAAISKFAFPNQHNLLFSYKFNEKYYNPLRNVMFYNLKKDWLMEMSRCGACGWRVMTAEKETPAGSLPTYYVVPKNVTNAEYTEFARYFRDSRPAIWMWGYEKSSLVRMADLLSTLPDTSRENAMMEKIRDCHPDKKQPHLLELTRILPSIQDVHHSYIKLRELCTPENARQFMIQESRFYSLLDKSSWLLYVSLCLKYADEMAEKLKDNETVVLQENDGRDMSALLSSLIQIILDQHTRTITGFQSLIQKEWIAMGHPFSDRLGLVINQSTTEQSPLFLLFLDCVFQLIQQFPEDFEYTETFLTTIWDSAFLPIFDTFQFNCEFDRYQASRRQDEKIILRPVWDWGEQFSDKDIALFSNPLYKRPPEIINSRKSAFLPPNAVALPILSAHKLTQPGKHLSAAPERQQSYFLENVKYNIVDLEIWSQCYYRWLPYLEIADGGTPQIDLFHRILINDISKLQQIIQTGDMDDPAALASNGEEVSTISNMTTTTAAAAAANLPSINSFFPFSRNACCNTNELIDILMQSSDLLTEGSIFDGLSLAQAPD